MKTLKLLKDFGEFKTGDLVDVSENDAKTLIEDGVGEVHIELTKHTATDPNNLEDDPVAKAAQAAVELLKASGDLDNITKVPAQPKDHTKKPNFFREQGFFKAVQTHDMSTLAPYFEHCKATGMSEAIDSDGGYLVPTEISNNIFDQMRNESRLRPMCTDMPINHSIERPFVDDFDKSSSWYAGIATYWIGEGAAPTGSKLKFGKYRLQLKKVGALLYATEELLADSPQGFEMMVTTGAGYALAKEIDEQIVNGSGAGQPMGIMNSSALVSVSKETGQAATTILTENVLKMQSRISNMSKAVWLINQNCFTQIYTLSLEVGAGSIPAMIVDLRDSTVPRMLGRPIIWCEHCQSIGTTGDIILTDLSQYNTASKAGQPGIQGQSSIHVKFIEGETTFRFTTRVDGQPMWRDPLTTKHGGTGGTVSPFVALATRAS